jgi:hypothetical protein
MDRHTLQVIFLIAAQRILKRTIKGVLKRILK